MRNYLPFGTAAFSLFTVAFAGCSNEEDLGGRSAGDASGAPGSSEASLSNLNDEQRGELCDWTMSLFEATYGQRTSGACQDAGAYPAFHVEPDPTRQACIDRLAVAHDRCAATVAQLQACCEAMPAAICAGAFSNASCERFGSVDGCPASCTPLGSWGGGP